MQSRSRFLKAAFCEQIDRPPVWMMRQAGRHLPEYQVLRQQHELLAMMKNEEIVVEVSLQPWRRYKTDAVIVFSDILIPVNAIGMDLKFIEGQGPKFAKLIASEADLKNLKSLEPLQDVPFLINGLRRLREELKDDAALLGFAGAPYTVASYVTQNFQTMQ
ncbi:MAG: uroporphyrinogen decarboxylase family protein, partial [Deltaproteobacteria bacterium]|nr:uroporphyrinogen decarboxylase family protein [Deltaproteobacteria bacterium]